MFEERVVAFVGQDFQFSLQAMQIGVAFIGGEDAVMMPSYLGRGKSNPPSIITPPKGGNNLLSSIGIGDDGEDLHIVEGIGIYLAGGYRPLRWAILNRKFHIPFLPSKGLSSLLLANI